MSSCPEINPVVFVRFFHEICESLLKASFLGSITTSPFGVAIEFLYQFAGVLRSSQEFSGVLRSSREFSGVLRSCARRPSSQEFSGVLRSSQEFSGVAPADRPSFSFESSTRSGNPPTRGGNTCSYEPPLIGVLKRTSLNLA